MKLNTKSNIISSLSSNKAATKINGTHVNGYSSVTKNIVENFSKGWIKLLRSIMEKGWYHDSEFVHLWIHLLLTANHTETEFYFNGKILKLKPGQLITGRKQLSVNTGIDESKIERILKCFQNDHQIEQQTTNKNRIITIVSWNDYQKSEQQSEQQMNNKRTTDEQQMNTYNNDNNINNEKKEINIAFEVFWNKYDKKVGRSEAEKKWISLSDESRSAAMQFIPAYVKAKPQKEFRRNPINFLNNETWKDELPKEATRNNDNTSNIVSLEIYEKRISEEIKEHEQLYDETYEEALDKVGRKYSSNLLAQPILDKLGYKNKNSFV